MAKRTNRVVWGLVVVLAVAVIGRVGSLGVRLKPYWIAKYHGAEADLRGARLFHAPLQRADLQEACLRGADLRRADLRDAYLGAADLRQADLRGADLRVITFCVISQGDEIEIPTAVANLSGARYDTHTRWPADYDPRRHGAILTR